MVEALPLSRQRHRSGKGNISYTQLTIPPVWRYTVAMVFLVSIVAVIILSCLLLLARPHFTRLRAALALADRVLTMEGTVQSLQFEWTDTLDKLLAREERWRKRYKAEVSRAFEIPETIKPPESSGDIKGDLRKRLGALRQG